MKALQKSKLKYYKYINTDSVNPQYSSQSQAELGVNEVKMITNPRYYAVTNSSGARLATNQVVTFDMGSQCISIKSIGYYGKVVAGKSPSLVMKNIQCSTDNSTWTTISSSFGKRGDFLTNPLVIPTPNNYRYIRWTCNRDDGGFSTGDAYNLTIKYVKRNSVESTYKDYDYYKLHNTYSLYKDNNELTYYKWTNWTQPTLTANGIMGVSNFACYANRSYDATQVNVYQAFSPNTGYIASYKSLAYSTLYIYFHSKNYLKLSNFSFYIPIKNSNNDTGGGYANTLKLEGFNANTNSWEQLAYIEGGTNMGNKTHTMNLSNNTKYYKYYRFQGRTGGGGHHDEIDISNIKITAQQAVECQRGQHDFYEEDLIYKAIP
jgi:hypothetical protein